MGKRRGGLGSEGVWRYDCNSVVRVKSCWLAQGMRIGGVACRRKKGWKVAHCGQAGEKVHNSFTTDDSQKGSCGVHARSEAWANSVPLSTVACVACQTRFTLLYCTMYPITLYVVRTWILVAAMSLSAIHMTCGLLRSCPLGSTPSWP